MPPNLDHHDEDAPTNFYPHKNPYEINSKIMIIAIVCLAAVIVLVIALHIYARCVLRRQARRRATLRQIGISTTIHVSDPPKTGLEPSVIASLPIFVYKTNIETPDNDDGTSKECAVCLSFLEDEELARLLPNCNHFFHSECIDKWLSSQSTCPICRTEAQPCIRPELREGPVSGDAPSAPPLERMNSIVEGTSVDIGASAKVNGSSTRLSSFRRMLTRERSSRRVIQEDGVQDLERQ